MATKHPVSSFSTIEKKLIRSVDQTIRNHSMIQSGDTVLAGVSGGPDSVALIHILHSLAPKYTLRLAIAHLNHGLRPSEADRDQAFVVSLAKNLEIPLYAETQDVQRYRKKHHLSIEEAARRLRYRFYHHTAEQQRCDKIALGHHVDDNAEQVLMAMLRGSGPLGLAGMPAVRPDRIIRPLINLRRIDILDYLAARGLDYVVDSSNRDLRFLRNKIRTRLIPELQDKYNPKCVESLNRLATILSAEEEWLENHVQKFFTDALVFEQPGRLGLSRTGLTSKPTAVQRRLIRKAVLQVKGNLRRIAFNHIEAVLKLVRQGTPAGAVDLPDGICVWRDGDRLLISESQHRRSRPHSGRLASEVPDYLYELPGPGVISIKEAGLQIQFSEMPIKQIADWRQTDPQIAFFDRDKLSFPLVTRNFRPGGRFSPLGVSGHQKLKKFFIDHKISRTERIKCPIVLSRNKIIWVAGYRLDNAVKIDTHTRYVLKAELLLA